MLFEPSGLTPDEYLEQEKRNERKTEYLDGGLRDMPATDELHFSIRLNCAFLLKEHLSSHHPEGRIYVSDMKVHIPAAKAFFYPDIMVLLAGQDSPNYYRVGPNLVVEVLSPGDAGFDRGRKFGVYRRIPELREYLLIESEYPAMECFRREGDHWVLYEYGPDDWLEIPSLGFKCKVEDIYQDVFSEE